LELLSLRTAPMRAFHLSWLAFFFCFFAWFGIAPLMPIVREELQLTQAQIGWCIVASVSVTILMRPLVGWLCESLGPRLTYTWLLVLSSLPVMGIGLCDDYVPFLICRLLIGVIGASFVVTQYHTSIMFAPHCVGTANATAAGWGNLGGGVTQFAMPWLCTLFASTLGLGVAVSWRLAMVVAGLVCLLTGLAYWRFTQDCPAGNFKELRAAGKWPPVGHGRTALVQACKDRRTWTLAAIYGACFGVELTIDNIAVLYFSDYFDLSLTSAGLAAGAFGLLNIAARALGGWFSDRSAAIFGLPSRVRWLFLAVLAEGLLLVAFSQAGSLPVALGLLLAFGLFVKMSNGATYAVVPFVNRQAVGPVAGIVGAGGNVGAVLAGLLFYGTLGWPTALAVLGAAVTATSFLALTVKLAPAGRPAAAPATADGSEAGIKLEA
jgi:NNP family nitrate/nitrite transporter-like MFS transporter